MATNALKKLNRRFQLKLDVDALLKLVSRTDEVGKIFRKRYADVYVDTLVKIAQTESQKPFFTGSLVGVRDYEELQKEAMQVWESCPMYHPIAFHRIIDIIPEMKGLVVA